MPPTFKDAPQLAKRAVMASEERAERLFKVGGEFLETHSAEVTEIDDFTIL